MADMMSRLDKVMNRLQMLNGKVQQLGEATGGSKQASTSLTNRSLKDRGFDSKHAQATTRTLKDRGFNRGDFLKYAEAFDGSEVKSFTGQEFVETTLYDFDMVFQFSNPNHAEDYEYVSAKALIKTHEETVMKEIGKLIPKSLLAHVTEHTHATEHTADSSDAVSRDVLAPSPAIAKPGTDAANIKANITDRAAMPSFEQATVVQKFVPDAMDTAALSLAVGTTVSIISIEGAWAAVQLSSGQKGLVPLVCLNRQDLKRRCTLQTRGLEALQQGVAKDAKDELTPALRGVSQSFQVTSQSIKDEEDKKEKEFCDKLAAYKGRNSRSIEGNIPWTNPESKRADTKWSSCLRYYNNWAHGGDSVDEIPPGAVTGVTATDLLKEFFIEPHQAQEVDISPDIKGLKDTRNAIIDIFLSFFRAQEEEDYYTYVFKSVDFDEIFLCVKMGERTARQHADESQYQLMMDADKIVKTGAEGGMGLRYEFEPERQGRFSWFWPLVESEYKYFGMHKEKYPELQAGSVQYNAGMEPLLKTYPQESLESHNSILREVDRIRLLYDKITDILNVHELMDWNLMEDFYPLHKKEALAKLKTSWADPRLFYTFTQPMHLIRDYFGEHIALYFVFVEHMLKYLIILAILAVVFTFTELVMEASSGWEASHGSWLRFLGGSTGVTGLRIAWSLCVIILCKVLQIRLRRKVTTKCTLWGVDTQLFSTIKEEVNSRFNKSATITASDLNANTSEINVTREQRVVGRLISRAGTVAFILLTVVCIIGTLYGKSSLHERDMGMPSASTYIGFFITFEIKVLSYIWGTLGNWLVDCEYWRTKLAYDNAFAHKHFIVKIILTFNGMFYIAFLMQEVGDNSYEAYGNWTEVKDGQIINHAPSNSWEYLTYLMLTNFASYLVFCTFDLISPWVKREFAIWGERKKMKLLGDEHLIYSFIEYQSKMTQYTGDDQTDDYMQILLPFGFVLFFGATLPISALLCWIFVAVQMRVDAWKLCGTCMKRPYPRTTSRDQWVWADIIDLYMNIAVITNIMLISFVLNPIASYSWPTKFAVCLGLCFFMQSVVNGFLESLFPEASDAVLLARRRHAHQRECAKGMCGLGQTPCMKLRASKDIRYDTGIHRLLQSELQPGTDEVFQAFDDSP